MGIGIRTLLLTTVVTLAAAVGTADAAQRPAPSLSVPCPAATGDPALYPQAQAAYRCHSAVTDMFGNVVILRVGRAEAAGRGAFGLAHADADRNLDAATIEQVVRTARPRPAPQQRVSYVTEVREPGGGPIQVWVEVDRAPSNQAPDTEPFGLLTAYCRDAGHPGEAHACPDGIGAAT